MQVADGLAVELGERADLDLAAVGQLDVAVGPGLLHGGCASRTKEAARAASVRVKGSSALRTRMARRAATGTVSSVGSGRSLISEP